MAVELQRRLDDDPFPREAGEFEFRVADHENESGEWECFDAVRRMRPGEYIQVVICADGGANFVYRFPVLRGKDDCRFETSIADVGDWSPLEVASLVHDTLRGNPDARETWLKLDVRKKK